MVAWRILSKREHSELRLNPGQPCIAEVVFHAAVLGGH